MKFFLFSLLLSFQAFAELKLVLEEPSDPDPVVYHISKDTPELPMIFNGLTPGIFYEVRLFGVSSDLDLYYYDSINSRGRARSFKRSVKAGASSETLGFLATSHQAHFVIENYDEKDVYYQLEIKKVEPLPHKNRIADLDLSDLPGSGYKSFVGHGISVHRISGLTENLIYTIKISNITDRKTEFIFTDSNGHEFFHDDDWDRSSSREFHFIPGNEIHIYAFGEHTSAGSSFEISVGLWEQSESLDSFNLFPSSVRDETPLNFHVISVPND